MAEVFTSDPCIVLRPATESYHSGAESPPLAASPAAHTVQDGDAGAQVLK